MNPYAVFGIPLQYWQCKSMAVGATQFATQNGRPSSKTAEKFVAQIPTKQ